jgi:hypothetical protein
MIGVISGAVATFLVVAVRVIVVQWCQSEPSDRGAMASCRMHCGADGANIEVTASSGAPPNNDGAPPVIERRRSSMGIVIAHVRSYVQQYRRTLTRYASFSRS